MEAKDSSYSSIWSAVNDAGGWTLMSAALGIKFTSDSTRAFLGDRGVFKADGRSSPVRHIVLSGRQRALPGQQTALSGQYKVTLERKRTLADQKGTSQTSTESSQANAQSSQTNGGPSCAKKTCVAINPKRSPHTERGSSGPTEGHQQVP